MMGIDGSNRKLTASNHVRAVLLLPFMSTVLIPAGLLVLFRDAQVGSAGVTTESLLAVAALALLAGGLSLAVRAVVLFVKTGRGTLAPWDPTEVLITEDLYRFSRNPMKIGLFLILIGETVLLRSAALAIWMVSFIIANVVYIRCFEEPGLRARFADEYDAYRRRVPRWLSLRRRRQDSNAMEDPS